MTKQDLPQVIFILSIDLQGRGAVDAQFPDDKGVHIPVFRDLQSATDWLRAGGLDLWTRQDSAMQSKLQMGGSPVVRQQESADYLQLLTLFGASPKKYVDFEPDQGSLFAPPDRQISI